MPRSIYLVGPEVFLPDPHDIDGQKKLICERDGFCGRFTLDSDLELDGVSPRAAGLRISEANEQLMRVCDLVIANITPFRGPSADVGTVYEMGFMRAFGKPVLAYTNKIGLYVERVLSRRQSGTKWVDDRGMTIESFEMTDTLMLEGAVASSCAHIQVLDIAPERLFTDLTAFEACVRLVREG